MVQRIVKRLRIHRYRQIRFRLMDIVCLAYVALIGFLLVFFHKNVNLWFFYLFIHVAIVIGILEILRLGEKYARKRILWFFRTFYPIALLLYAWTELDALLPMLFGNYWATELIIRWDKFFFGVHPTVWIQQFYQPWLDELMNFFYAAYFTFFLLIPLCFFCRKKYQETFAILSIIILTYFSNFILFYLLPVVSPQSSPMLQVLHTKQYGGYIFSEINRWAQASGSSLGASFPSSHVSGALVWVLSAWRFSKKLGLALAPISIGIGVATVYLGWHHAMDPIFGYIWGIICYLIATKLIKKRGEDPLEIAEKSAASR